MWRSRKYLRRIEALDPRRDYHEISYLSGGYEFPWDSTRALEIALLRTYCAPSISRILHRTGEFEKFAQRRYDDTTILLGEIVKYGPASERGRAALERMNRIHSFFKISNEDYLYVLSTFIYIPIAWLEKYGWRRPCENEKLAAFHLWREIGLGMGIRDIPETYEAFEEFSLNYEKRVFRYSEENRAVADATTAIFIGWFPRFLSPLIRRGIYAMLDEPMRIAFNYPKPANWFITLVQGSLRLRGFALRFLPARRKPSFPTDERIRSYPQGYKLNEVGPPRLLEKLNAADHRDIAAK